MMQHEFEQLTGMKVSCKTYDAIETLYYAFDGDKCAFCKDFMAHKDKRLMQLIDEQIVNLDVATRIYRYEVKELRGVIKGMEAEIEKLDKLLRKEQEWKPYEDSHNTKQSEYEALQKSSDTRELSENEARDMIADEFGFDPSKIIICNNVGKEEINRHNQVRRAGEYERNPLYNAADWNYVRFNVCGMAYEMHNGELKMFWN